MELGALVCTPRLPSCPTCPVQKLCVAFRESRQAELPNLGKGKAATARRFIAFVVQRHGKFLVRQRPAGVVNAHLWEFPNSEAGDAKGRARHSVRAAFRPASIKPLCTLKHSITRYRITLEAYCAELANARTKLEGQWLTLPQLRKLAFTSAHKKILGKLGKRR